MGPIKTPQSSQGYPNQHDNNSRSPPPPQDANMEDIPPPETYPPQPEPVQFPPQQKQPPPKPVQFPPQPEPVRFPPQPQPVPIQPQPQPFPFPQPQPQQPPLQGWKHNDLFGCADDPENAIITAFFPCITFGQIAEVVDNGQTSCATSGLIYGITFFTVVPYIMSCMYRTKIRNRYGLMETPAPDWVTHFFCEWCALCQEYRELKARGLDPAIGWQGNLDRNQQQYAGMAMNPPMNQRMM